MASRAACPPAVKAADGQPGPPGKSGRQRGTGVEQPSGPSWPRPPAAGGGPDLPWRHQLCGSTPATPEVGLGQVDATTPGILGHVLEVLDDLEPVADVVGQRDALGGCGAEDPEHQASHRGGRQSAVAEKVVEGLVGVNPLVLAVGLDEVHERVERKAQTDQGRAQSLEQRMAGPAFGRPAQLGLEPVQLGQSVTLRLVADVVGQPGETVDGHQVGPHGAGQEPGGDGEVLVPA